MKPKFHVLNGDCLKEQFPDSISGEQIIMRECLVDGDVTAKTLEEFYQTRAKFISSMVNDVNQPDYYDKVVSEFHKIQSIPEKSRVYLWFEDDLFCQVNMWFVLHLLYESHKQLDLFLVRPQVHTRYGFGGLNETELISIFNTRVQLTQLDLWSQLWKSYQSNDMKEMVTLAKQLEKTYPFLTQAVQAHIDRIPNINNLGKPKTILLNIMEELETDDFKIIFAEFSKRAPIYGFGDLQVKRLMDELNA